MLAGNNISDDINVNSKPKNLSFQQEYKLSLDKISPDITNLKAHVGGAEINRENEIGELVTVSSQRKRFEVESNPGIQLEYQTGDNIKLEFGPDDQIIEHIFTMHWSQIDKILLRAKVNGETAPPSKRMTIMEVGKDVYSKERNLITGGNSIYQNGMGRLSIFLLIIS